jgi:hypothetical protein
MATQLAPFAGEENLTWIGITPVRKAKASNEQDQFCYASALPKLEGTTWQRV